MTSAHLSSISLCQMPNCSLQKKSLLWGNKEKSNHSHTSSPQEFNSKQYFLKSKNTRFFWYKNKTWQQNTTVYVVFWVGLPVLLYRCVLGSFLWIQVKSLNDILNSIYGSGHFYATLWICFRPFTAKWKFSIGLSLWLRGGQKMFFN